MLGRLFTSGMIAILSCCSCFAAVGEDAAKPRAPESIHAPHLENAFKFTATVWGGAEPHDEDAFKVLQQIGVKTIISVDGAKPDAVLARKYGMKYVHLPIGYDEVPADRAKELAKAINELPGPFFVHCHHGKHRSPAALATACVVNGTLTNDEAVLAMKTAGTGENYIGLWDSAKTAKPADPKELAALKVEFREQAPVPPLAEAMVGIDRYFVHLKQCRKAGWTQPKDHPDLEPAHEALKLREIYTELMRTDEFKKRSEEFKKLTQESESDAKALEAALRKAKKSSDETLLKEIDGIYARIEKSCKDCHTAYRNVPQK